MSVSFKQVVNFNKTFFTFSDFSDAGNSKTISIPLGKIAVLAFVLKNTEAFSGVLISGYSINAILKDNLGNQVGGMPAPLDAFATPSALNYAVSWDALSGGIGNSGQDVVPLFEGGTLELTAISVSDTLNHATQGKLDVYISAFYLT